MTVKAVVTKKVAAAVLQQIKAGPVDVVAMTVLGDGSRIGGGDSVKSGSVGAAVA